MVTGSVFDNRTRGRLHSGREVHVDAVWRTSCGNLHLHRVGVSVHRAMNGYADSMQMKVPARCSPNGINVYLSPGVKSPTSPVIKDAPGNHCGSGTYSPNGIRRILSYCAISRPSSFISSAEL